MKKIFKNILGVLLLPFCAGAVTAVWTALSAFGAKSAVILPFIAGALAWLAVFLFLPRPESLYVFGHEATHAIFSWLSGGKLKKMKVGAVGGHVLITKSNFLTSLAPYFFPFYAVLIIIIFDIAGFLWNLSPFSSFLYFFLGLAYAFHITFTASTLKIHQPDIAEEGYIFSGVVILLGNLLVLLLGIALLGQSISFSGVFGSWISKSVEVYRYLSGLF